jgi:hypothetical protein
MATEVRRIRCDVLIVKLLRSQVQPSCPEEKLLFAVLERAIRDALGASDTDRASDRPDAFTRRAAREWIEGEAMEWACSWLDIDPEFVRKYCRRFNWGDFDAETVSKTSLGHSVNYQIRGNEHCRASRR